MSDGSNATRTCVVCGAVRKKTKGVACKPCYMKARAETYLTLTCQQCSTQFTRQRAEHEKKLRKGSTSTFCSLPCSQQATRLRMARRCKTCATPMLGERHRWFCSPECRAANRPEKKRKFCPQCGVDFEYSSSRREYCTRTCSDAAHSRRMVGAGNSHYKDGTSYASWFRRMRPLIAERDQHLCRVCMQPDKPYPVTRAGKTAMRSSMVVHHINEDPRDNLPENLILLCKTCHAVHHKSTTTPFPWFAQYAASATTSMTSKWTETVTSLQKKFSSTTA